MKHTDLSTNFNLFTESFYNIEPIEFDLKEQEISKAIFTHIFKIKSSLRKQSAEFKRDKIISISEIFQDIIALYLKLGLGTEYDVILEPKINRLQPDILIKYNDKNLFIVEIKTTIGWDRGSLDDGIGKRIKDLSETFHIPKENIVYILQSPWNMKKEFTEKYWNINEKKARPLPTDDLYSKIRPLLTGDDPFYWKEEDKDENYFGYSDEKIYQLAESRIVVPLELTINQIKEAIKEI